MTTHPAFHILSQETNVCHLIVAYLLLPLVTCALVQNGSLVKLHSFIVSNTPSHTMRMLWGMDKPALTARHILCQEEDRESYIGAMLADFTL